MFTIILLALISYTIYRLYQHFFPTPNINPNGKYVLISGCDSGFGHGFAIELDKQGFNVLAGVFTENSVTSLKNELSPRAIVFHLDITKQQDIDAAFDLVKEKTNTLHALVNNAGISMGANIDWTSMELLRKVMDVNFFGHVTMNKKFLPLLIAKRDSRVVNICSMCGFIGIPGSAAYCASKYALESFSDCLRREMFPWGLRVSIIEPGTMRTSMIEGIEQTVRSIWLESPIEIRERWGEEFFNNSLQLIINSPFVKYSESPEKVIRVLKHAIMSTTPQIRYRPGWQSSLFFYPLSLLPVWLVDKIFSLATTVHPAGLKYQ
jgi:17beta-estradiol 17-dehydrogenase/all-trans-retinol dehydrogenase (NAD+)/3alpha(17beta)-hydroxysteroid dehydrogenase (NAD+)